MKKAKGYCDTRKWELGLGGVKETGWRREKTRVWQKKTKECRYGLQSLLRVTGGTEPKSHAVQNRSECSFSVWRMLLNWACSENSFIASVHEQLHFHRLPPAVYKREIPTKPITHLSNLQPGRFCWTSPSPRLAPLFSVYVCVCQFMPAKYHWD